MGFKASELTTWVRLFRGFASDVVQGPRQHICKGRYTYRHPYVL
mgnify:CR=1 FL=1|jgi:hypothetical protein